MITDNRPWAPIAFSESSDQIKLPSEPWKALKEMWRSPEVQPREQGYSYTPHTLRLCCSIEHGESRNGAECKQKYEER